ncbi:MAG: alcohol acetyltransferase, partial [Propionibacterium sp.]|nr:alcohol acetyltransferase [Propionibacterium sp.]
MARRESRQRRQWVRLDNASNIFLAARSEVDTKVFRLSAELDDDVEPAQLQEALDRTFAQYPLFSAVLRQGIFWYYLQESDLQPTVKADDAPSVQHLYHRDRHDLLFRVLYRGRRVSFEVFHALTDGTGALWFFQDLLTEYIGLSHPHEFEKAAWDLGGIKQEFAVDAFTHWFHAGEGSFEDEATAALEARSTQLPEVEDEPEDRKVRRRRRRDVLSVTGTYTPDHRSRVVELTMPVKPVLALARAEGVSLTIYLLALFFESLRATRMASGKARTIVCSVPVNLRQFFPTDSGRNFFATTMLAHTYRNDPEHDSISGVCRDLDRQFKRTLTKEGLERKIRRLVRFERNPALRVIPRPLKDLIL